jgi:4-amino-4-deoxy-L-arabinose transferase-like glycosyltransferase
VKANQSSLLTLSAISVGLGIGVKKSYFILLPILGVIALHVILQFGRRTWKPLMIWSVNLLLAVAILGSYIYVVNWKYFGDPFGTPAYIDMMLDVPQSRKESPRVKLSLARVSQQSSAAISALQESGSSRDIFHEVIYNAPRLFYQALDTSGLPRPLDGYSHKVKLRLARAFFKAIGFEEIEGTAYTAPGHKFSFDQKNVGEESHAWYGLLSILLIFPGSH